MSSSDSTSTLSLENCKCSEEPAKVECEHLDSCNHTPETKSKKSSSLSSLAQNLRRGPSLNFANKRLRKSGRQSKDLATSPSSSSKKSPKWVMKFNCTKKERKCTEEAKNKCCVCTCYKRTEEHHLGAGVVFQTNESVETNEDSTKSITNDSITLENNEIAAEVSQPSSIQHSPSVENIEEANTPSTHEVYGSIAGPNNTSIILRSPLIDISW